MGSYKLLIYTVLLSSLAACGRKPVRPQIESFKLDTLFRAGETTFEISYDFATIANASRSPVLRGIEESNILYFFGQEEFAGTARDAASAAVAEFREACGDTFPSQWSAYMSVSSEAEVTDTLLVYTIYRDEYTGGAHGMRSVECHNYSLAGGFELATGDLFDPRQAEELTRLIHSKLLDMFLVEDDDGLTRVGFFPDQIAITENFRVTNNGITFVYNPYDIACYAVGMVEVPVSNEELTALRLR